MDVNFSLINKAKSKVPSLPFMDIKKEILGEKYDLSVAYVTIAKIRELNMRYRKKDKATNVLSFALDKNSGELIICPEIVKKELKKFERNFRQLLGYLVIHGMLHLKGYEHGEKMDKAEKKYLSHTKF